MIACACHGIHDGSACLCACHLTYELADGGRGILDSDEVADLAIIAARRNSAVKLMAQVEKAGKSRTRLTVAYADDLQPMVYRDHDANGREVERVTPWQWAMEV